MDNKKHVAFEPVSAEEVKQIRASSGGSNPLFGSGAEGGSGSKIEACKGKKLCDKCSFEGSDGNIYSGHCMSMVVGGLHCSDFNGCPD